MGEQGAAGDPNAQVHGDLQMPYTLVVPSSGEWEERLWRLQLGTANWQRTPQAMSVVVPSQRTENLNTCNTRRDGEETFKGNTKRRVNDIRHQAAERRQEADRQTKVGA